MKRTDIIQFLSLAEKYPVIDVRSPLEYQSGHIPDSINIPLFTDVQRASVGTKYKKEGSLEAILEGIKLSGPFMHEKLKKAIETARDGKLLVHCWRGGMRSEAMGWLFSLGNIEIDVLEGGYKAYRNHILGSLAETKDLIVLGGMTGSSKTHILNYLKENGHQVIDLEGLANHKGSAFGSLGLGQQPSTEQFANDLHLKWSRTDRNLPVWVEDESRNIGSVFLPEVFYNNMQKSRTIVLMMDIKTRMPRLLKEYSSYPPDELKASVSKISKRLGGDSTKEALQAIDAGDFQKAIEISLRYYDKAYQYSIARKNNPHTIFLETDTDDIEANARKILLSLRPS